MCGWRMYPTPRRLRLSPRDRAQRRDRVRRVALEASERGACHTCGADAVTAKHCQRHRDLNNAAARDTAPPTTPSGGPAGVDPLEMPAGGLKNRATLP